MIELRWMGRQLQYRLSVGVDASGALCLGEIGEWQNVPEANYYDEQLCDERDTAENAADRLASLVLGQPIDWTCHEEVWKRAISALESEVTMSIDYSALRDWECPSCRVKPGMPLLCDHCLRVRDLWLRNAKLVEAVKAYRDCYDELGEQLLDSINNRERASVRRHVREDGRSTSSDVPGTIGGHG